MLAGERRMSDFHLTLTSSERDLLTRILTDQQKGKRVEVHRTEFNRDFRHELEAEEAEITQILDKLSHTVAAG